MIGFYQPQVRERLSQEEESRLEAFTLALKEHMRDLMLHRSGKFKSIDEVYLRCKQEELDVHLARLDPGNANAVLREQIDHVANLGLGVVDLSQGAYDYSSKAVISHQVY